MGQLRTANKRRDRAIAKLQAHAKTRDAVVAESTSEPAETVS